MAAIGTRSPEALMADPGEHFYSLGQVWVKETDGLLYRSREEGQQPEERVSSSAAPVSRMVAGLRQLWDAAFPPASPPNTEGVCGYIGGGTPHIWSDTEWAAALARSTASLRLPIFVRVPPTTKDPRMEAQFCIAWARDHDQPRGSLIALDYETAIDATYLNAFDDVIMAGGYKCIVYGSRSFVMQNPKPSGGYWTATWNNTPHLDSGAAMTQYGGDVTLGQPWDINVAADATPLWNTEADVVTEADLPILKRAVREVLLVSENGMNIIQFGQANNDKAFNILATRLETLKTQISALSGTLSDDEANLLAALQGTEGRLLTAVSAIQAGDPGPLIEEIKKLPAETLEVLRQALAS